MIEMCGIAGFLSINLTDEEALKIATTLLLEQEERGKDATGIYTDGRIVKAPLKASDFIRYLPETFGKITLLHNRSATKGSEWDNNNNHPLFSDNWVLIHNGVLRMEKLATYKYMGEVDSEILLSYIETQGLPEALTKVEGSAAIAVIHQKGKSIFLWRNSAPIILGYIPKKCIIFASTAAAILKAAQQILPLKLDMFPEVYLSDTESEQLIRVSRNKIKKLGIFKSKEDTRYYSKFGFERYYGSKVNSESGSGYWMYNSTDDKFHWWNYDKEKKEHVQTDKTAKHREEITGPIEYEF